MMLCQYIDTLDTLTVKVVANVTVCLGHEVSLHKTFNEKYSLRTKSKIKRKMEN